MQDLIKQEITICESKINEEKLSHNNIKQVFWEGRLSGLHAALSMAIEILPPICSCEWSHIANYGKFDQCLRCGLPMLKLKKGEK